MAKLIYSAIASLDGHVEDSRGRFEWAEPGDEVFRFVNECERPVGTYLFGRRMYETMVFWETAGRGDGGEPDAVVEFADLWRAADKVVYSRTLSTVSSERTRLESTFAAAEVASMKADADRDLTIGGAELAGQALRAGVVDELQLLIVPVVVGGGKRWLADQVALDLVLHDTRSFADGTVFLRYGVRPPTA